MNSKNSGKEKNKSKKRKSKYRRNKISAGSYYINKWLYGGYDKGVITTFYGPAGSGKTNFSTLVAVSQARKGNKVLFIDTEGSFSTERVKQIAGDDIYEKVLDNIVVLKVTNFGEQKKAFSKLNDKVSKSINLIVVDGMTMLYRLELGEAKEEDIKKVNKELVKQMRVLAEIARKNNIAVVATNQVYSDFLSGEDVEEGKEKKYHMVGGDIMKYWSKCIIELKKNGKKRKAKLIKHRSLPEKELDFIITQRGIKKRGFL